MERNIFTATKTFFIFLACLGVVPYYFQNRRWAPQFNSAYIALLVLFYAALFYECINIDIVARWEIEITSHTILLTLRVTQAIVTFVHTVIKRKKSRIWQK